MAFAFGAHEHRPSKEKYAGLLMSKAARRGKLPADPLHRPLDLPPEDDEPKPTRSRYGKDGKKEKPPLIPPEAAEAKFVSKGLTSAATMPILDALAAHERVQRLSLKDNRVANMIKPRRGHMQAGVAYEGTPEWGAVERLCDIAATHTSLTELSLTSNWLGDDSVRLLAPLLQRATGLTTLRLRDNNISPAGRARLLAALLANPRSGIRHLSFTEWALTPSTRELHCIGPLAPTDRRRQKPRQRRDDDDDEEQEEEEEEEEAAVGGSVGQQGLHAVDVALLAHLLARDPRVRLVDLSRQRGLFRRPPPPTAAELPLLLAAHRGATEVVATAAAAAANAETADTGDASEGESIDAAALAPAPAAALLAAVPPAHAESQWLQHRAAGAPALRPVHATDGSSMPAAAGALWDLLVRGDSPFQRLRGLRVAHVTLHDAFVARLAAALKQPQRLEHLWLTNVQMSAGAQAELARAVLESTLASFNDIPLRDMRTLSAAAAAKAVAAEATRPDFMAAGGSVMLQMMHSAASAATALNLSSRAITDCGGRVLAHALGASHCTTALDISGCRLSQDCMRLLVAAVGRSAAYVHTDLRKVHTAAALTSLNLSGNALGEHGAAALAAALRGGAQQASLTSLDVSDTELGSRGTCHLLDALRTHPALVRLNVSGNGGQCAAAFAAALLVRDSPGLSWLDLSTNSLGTSLDPDTGLHLPDPRGVVALVVALQSTTTLTHLSLRYCGVGRHMAAAIAAYLRADGSLPHMDLPVVVDGEVLAPEDPRAEEAAAQARGDVWAGAGCAERVTDEELAALLQPPAARGARGAAVEGGRAEAAAATAAAAEGAGAPGDASARAARSRFSRMGRDRRAAAAAAAEANVAAAAPGTPTALTFASASAASGWNSRHSRPRQPPASLRVLDLSLNDMRVDDTLQLSARSAAFAAAFNWRFHLPPAADSDDDLGDPLTDFAPVAAGPSRKRMVGADAHPEPALLARRASAASLTAATPGTPTARSGAGAGSPARAPRLGLQRMSSAWLVGGEADDGTGRRLQGAVGRVVADSDPNAPPELTYEALWNLGKSLQRNTVLQLLRVSRDSMRLPVQVLRGAYKLDTPGPASPTRTSTGGAYTPVSVALGSRAGARAREGGLAAAEAANRARSRHSGRGAADGTAGGGASGAATDGDGGGGGGGGSGDGGGELRASDFGVSAWIQLSTEEGYPYYYNTETGESQWEPPQAGTQPAPAPTEAAAAAAPTPVFSGWAGGMGEARQKQMQEAAAAAASRRSASLSYMTDRRPPKPRMKVAVDGELYDMGALNFRMRKLKPVDCILMARLLEVNPVVTSLDLHDNLVGPEGAAALASAIKWSTTLRVVDLSRNDLTKCGRTPRGVRELLDAVRGSKSMAVLVMSECRLTDACVRALEETWRVNNRLRSVDVHGNLFTASGLGRLKQLHTKYRVFRVMG